MIIMTLAWHITCVSFTRDNKLTFTGILQLFTQQKHLGYLSVCMAVKIMLKQINNNKTLARVESIT